MNSQDNVKYNRLLHIYTKLLNGQLVNKRDEADYFHVNERSIQRDIEDIREYLDAEAHRSGVFSLIEYDRSAKGYRMKQASKMMLTNSEILAVCKILLDSRAFTKAEMTSILTRLVDCCSPKENSHLVMELIQNEAFHYIEPQHKTKFIDTMWKIGEAIHASKYIEIEYKKGSGNTLVKRKLKPLAIMFSEYYFYLTAFIDDKDEVRNNFEILNDAFPTIYRIDRIKQLRILDQHFHIPYRNRFEEGEFRKRIQFMYGGKLQRIKFQYSGNNVEAVLDRLPTARILSEDEGVFTISAEVFGKGIDMWIRSQGDNIKVLSAHEEEG